MAERARLSADDWVAAALEVLVNDGISAVKILPLAKKLGVTRGSFYWHFENHEALLNRLLEVWEETNSGTIIAAATREGGIVERYIALMRCWLSMERFDPHLEVAVRHWGRSNPELWGRLRTADERRVEAFVAMLAPEVPDPTMALHRARTMYYCRVRQRLGCASAFGLAGCGALVGMAERVRVREISSGEGSRLLRLVRRSSGSVVTWRRAQIVLWSAQGMDAPQIAPLAFTSEDRVREVIRNFNADGFGSLYPKYAGGRPPRFSAGQRAQIKRIALGRPADRGLPFSTWSLAKLAEHLVAKGVVDDISHEGLRVLLREEGVSFQAIKTYKESNDPDFEAKKNRILGLYDIADAKTQPEPGDPAVVICMDEFGPLNLQPHPGKQWAPVGGKHKDPHRAPRRRRRATYTRPHGVRHLLAAYDMTSDKLYGHMKKRKTRTQFLEFCRYLRTLHPPQVRIAIVLDNFSPHLSTNKDSRVGDWAKANNVELAYTPHYASWLNRIEAHFQALRYFCVDGTDHPTHAEQASIIRRYIRWRNNNAADKALNDIVNRANVC